MGRSRGKTLLAFISRAWSATISSNPTPSLLTFRTCRSFCNAELGPQIWAHKCLSAAVFRPGTRAQVVALLLRKCLGSFEVAASYDQAVALVCVDGIGRDHRVWRRGVLHSPRGSRHNGRRTRRL